MEVAELLPPSAVTLLLLAATIVLLCIAFKGKVKLAESAVVLRDNIVICLNPNATIVRLDDTSKYNSKYRDTHLLELRRMIQQWTIAVFSRINSLWNNLLVLIGIRPQTYNVLLVGEFGSGRSSLLNALKGKPFQHYHPPTWHPEKHSITHQGTPAIELVFYEVSDQGCARRLLQDYFPGAHAVLYMVDASGRAEFPVNKKEMSAIMFDNDLQGKPILVLGNKIDLPSAVSEDALRQSLGLVACDELDDKDRVKLFMCSVKRNVGYADGLKWLHRKLAKR